MTHNGPEQLQQASVFVERAAEIPDIAASCKTQWLKVLCLGRSNTHSRH